MEFVGLGTDLAGASFSTHYTAGGGEIRPTNHHRFLSNNFISPFIDIVHEVVAVKLTKSEEVVPSEGISPFPDLTIKILKRH